VGATSVWSSLTFRIWVPRKCLAAHTLRSTQVRKDQFDKALDRDSLCRRLERNSMRRITAAGLVAIAFALGFLSRLAIRDGDSQTQSSMRDHWHTVDQYVKELEDPDNAREIDGMRGVATTTDLLPALAALVSAGELSHVDLVFPNVPSTTESNRIWIEYVNNHRDIIYAEGNPEYVDLQTSGSKPLHLHIWFRNSATADIRELIRLLERASTEG
jgi:hypothetical protein